jgi:hypothetical protein
MACLLHVTDTALALQGSPRAGIAVAFRNPNACGPPGTDEASELTGVENDIGCAIPGQRPGYLSYVVADPGGDVYFGFTQ